MKLSKKGILKIKKLIKESKDKKLIKPHIEAFNDFPVSEEEHKGKKRYYKN